MRSTKQAIGVYDRFRVIARAVSLGGVETLVSLPFNTSHARFTSEQRSAAQIPPGFVRVSVGVEDLADIVADFDQALARC